jgi:hypothetical protein
MSPPAARAVDFMKCRREGVFPVVLFFFIDGCEGCGNRKKTQNCVISIKWLQMLVFRGMGHPESLGDFQVTSFRWLKFLDFTIIYWRKGVI